MLDENHKTILSNSYDNCSATTNAASWYIRGHTILRSQFATLSFKDFLFLVLRLAWTVQPVRVYARKLDNDDIPGREYVKEGSIIKLSLNELEEIRKRMQAPPWEFFCSLYDKVSDCFVFKTENNRIGHISWVYYKNDPNRMINLRGNEAEIKYSLTMEEHRGKGLFPAVLIEIQRHLKRNGYSRVYISVNEGNAPAITGVLKAGFACVGRVMFKRLMGMRLNKYYTGP